MITTKRPTAPALRILVLAAGYSRRLGRPKALARVHGVSLLRRTLVLLAPLSRAPVITVVPPQAARYRAELRGLNTTLISNRERAAGLSSSVRLGVRHARFSSALLILPVDLANLQARELERLMHRWRSAPRRVVARRLAGRAVAPLILPKRFFGGARAITGDGGLRDFVALLPAATAVLIAVPSAIRDVDTPRDLALARRPRGIS
jgi:molybdenum cofactor cytidylyltransferase